jgi:membrane fusion protein, multidrug efflux system
MRATKRLARHDDAARWVAGLALAAAAAVLAACGGGHETAPPAPPPAVTAELATAERIEVPRRVELYGSVEAARTASVSTRVMAVVTAVRAQVGDEVRAGQLLAEIDPQATAGQLAQAKGGLGQAQAALALAARNFQRYQALAAHDAASELEVDLARSQFDGAKAAVEQAQGAVSAASSVAADARVTAPFAGRLARRMVEVGDLASPGRPLFEIESAGERRFAVAVPESVVAAAGLAPGVAVPVRLDARPDLGDIAGTVVEMTPGADPASHSYRVKIALGTVAVPSGAAGRAALTLTGDRRQAVVVPPSAVLTRGGLELVVLRDADGHAATRAVTLGETLADGRVEVLSGLDGGETVLLGLAAPPPAGARVSSSGQPAAGRAS